jgi:hypothetical protein
VELEQADAVAMRADDQISQLAGDPVAAPAADEAQGKGSRRVSAAARRRWCALAG